MSNTSRSPSPPVDQDEAPAAVRPERFAWSDGEALLIFSSSSPSKIRRLFSDEGDRDSSILVGGRFDPCIEDVRSAMEAAQNALIDRFVIVERSHKHFMQCLCQGERWILEKQEGSEDAHFRAMLHPAEAAAMTGDDALMSRIFSPRQQPAYTLTFAQVREAMQRYFDGEPEPHWLGWERIDIP